MSNERPRKPSPTLGGLGAPRVPIIEARGSTMPSNPEPERHDSIGALDENDRALLQRVLNTAKQAIDTSKADRERLEARVEAEAKERIALEGKVVSRFSDYDQKLSALAEDVSDLRGVAGDLRGVRGAMDSLSADVRANLAQDAVRDRAHFELKLEVERIANATGRSAGKSAGARWGVLSGFAPLALGFIVWLVTALISLAQGKPPPSFPSIGGPGH